MGYKKVCHFAEFSYRDKLSLQLGFPTMQLSALLKMRKKQLCYI